MILIIQNHHVETEKLLSRSLNGQPPDNGPAEAAVVSADPVPLREKAPAGKLAWRRTGTEESLPEVHRSIPVPQQAPVWRKMAAFAGPGFLVAVGYMDPGNWAT